MSHPTELPREPRGNADEASWLKKILRCVTERTLIAGKGIRMEWKRNGTVISAEPTEPQKRGADGIVKQFRVLSVWDDVVYGVGWNGTSPTSEGQTIAKPYKLRRTPWHGQTVQYVLEDPISGDQSFSVSYNYFSGSFRTASITSGAFTAVEKQVIIPKYQEDDIIYAAQPDGGTSVSGVDWLDINADGRAWARSQ